MSLRAVKWAKRQATGQSTRKLVLIVLAALADREGEARCSNKALAAACEISAEAVRSHVAELEKAGLIERVPTFRDGGAQGENRFIVKHKRALRSGAGAGLGAARGGSGQWKEARA